MCDIYFPQAGILLEIFDGREGAGEAQKHHVMGISHGCNIPEPPDRWGCHPITRRRVLFTRDGVEEGSLYSNRSKKLQ